MPKSYPAIPPSLKPAKINASTMEAIGRLVRACAEIEDLVDLFIATLAEVNESRALILLGRTAITRRLEIAEQLAKIRTDNAHAVFKQIFDANFFEVLECRNTVAHGVLIGKTPKGDLAFLTTPTGKSNGESAIRLVVSYSPKTINAIAKAAEKIIPDVEKALQVTELREERLRRPLVPHAKAQAQVRAKPQRPPQS